MSLHLGLLWAINLPALYPILAVFFRPLRRPLRWIAIEYRLWVFNLPRGMRDEMHGSWRKTSVAITLLLWVLFGAHVLHHRGHLDQISLGRPLNLMPALIIVCWGLVGIEWLFYAQYNAENRYSQWLAQRSQ